MSCARGLMIGPTASGGYRSTCPTCGEMLVGGTPESLSEQIGLHVDRSRAQRDRGEIRRRLARARAAIDRGSGAA